MKETFVCVLGCLFLSQQLLAQTDSTENHTHDMQFVVVKATKGIKSKFRVENTEIIGQDN